MRRRRKSSGRRCYGWRKTIANLAKTTFLAPRARFQIATAGMVLSGEVVSCLFN